jgi:hypothetical protein
MHKILTAICALAIGSTVIAGCDGKVENKNVTHYATDLCSLDVIAGKPDATVYVHRETVVFAGWAIDASKRISPEKLRLRLTGAAGVPYTFEGPNMTDRPDVAKVYNNDKLLKTGFNFTADLSKLQPGGYGIILEIPDGNSLLVCQPKKVLVVQ